MELIRASFSPRTMCSVAGKANLRSYIKAAEQRAGGIASVDLGFWVTDFYRVWGTPSSVKWNEKGTRKWQRPHSIAHKYLAASRTVMGVYLGIQLYTLNAHMSSMKQNQSVQVSPSQTMIQTYYGRLGHLSGNSQFHTYAHIWCQVVVN